MAAHWKTLVTVVGLHALIGTTDNKDLNCTEPCLCCKNGICNSAGKCDFCTTGFTGPDCKEPCHTNCKSCSQSFLETKECFECIGGFYIGTYKDQNTYPLLKDCSLACKHDCVNCSSFLNCLQCKIGYFLDANNDCRECPFRCSRCLSEGDCRICNEGYFWDGAACHHCMPPCKSCKSPNKCDACSDGYLLLNGTCSKCSASCRSCVVNGQFEQVCQKCEEGYYIHGDKCRNCSEHCRLCLNDTHCQKCERGYKQNGGICLSCEEPCTNCSSHNTCISCQEKYFNMHGKCMIYPDSCLRCVSDIKLKTNYSSFLPANNILVCSDKVDQCEFMSKVDDCPGYSTACLQDLCKQIADECQHSNSDGNTTGRSDQGMNTDEKDTPKNSTQNIVIVALVIALCFAFLGFFAKRQWITSRCRGDLKGEPNENKENVSKEESQPLVLDDLDSRKPNPTEEELQSDLGEADSQGRTSRQSFDDQTEIKVSYGGTLIDDDQSTTVFIETTGLEFENSKTKSDNCTTTGEELSSAIDYAENQGRTSRHSFDDQTQKKGSYGGTFIADDLSTTVLIETTGLEFENSRTKSDTCTTDEEKLPSAVYDAENLGRTSRHSFDDQTQIKATYGRTLTADDQSTTVVIETTGLEFENPSTNSDNCTTTGEELSRAVDNAENQGRTSRHSFDDQTQIKGSYGGTLITDDLSTTAVIETTGLEFENSRTKSDNCTTDEEQLSTVTDSSEKGDLNFSHIYDLQKEAKDKNVDGLEDDKETGKLYIKYTVSPFWDLQITPDMDINLNKTKEESLDIYISKTEQQLLEKMLISTFLAGLPHVQCKENFVTKTGQLKPLKTEREYSTGEVMIDKYVKSLKQKELSERSCNEVLDGLKTGNITLEMLAFFGNQLKESVPKFEENVRTVNLGILNKYGSGFTRFIPAMILKTCEVYQVSSKNNSCLFNAVSVALFGNENRGAMLKLLTATLGAANREKIVNELINRFETKEDVIAWAAEFLPEAKQKQLLGSKREILEKVLQDEILSILDNSDSGCVQLEILANIIGRRIKVYQINVYTRSFGTNEGKTINLVYVPMHLSKESKTNGFNHFVPAIEMQKEKLCLAESVDLCQGQQDKWAQCRKCYRWLHFQCAFGDVGDTHEIDDCGCTKIRPFDSEKTRSLFRDEKKVHEMLRELESCLKTLCEDLIKPDDQAKFLSRRKNAVVREKKQSTDDLVAADTKVVHAIKAFIYNILEEKVEDTLTQRVLVPEVFVRLIMKEEKCNRLEAECILKDSKDITADVEYSEPVQVH